jgi:ABC-type phosphate/phosphonate transport system ATPase subunit
MIELLGVGVPRDGGGWRVRRVCAHIRPGELTAVVSRDRHEGQAIFDAITGRRIPVEGRIWVNGVPLMRETASRVRGLVGEARIDARLSEGRSLFWNALAAPGQSVRLVHGLLRYPQPSERHAVRRALGLVSLEARAWDRVRTLDTSARASFALARALAMAPAYIVIGDLAVGDIAEAVRVLAQARRLAESERVGIVVGLPDLELARGVVHRVLGFAGGSLVFEGAPADSPREAELRARLA